MTNNIDSNQTQFSAQEPMREGLASYEDQVAEEVQPKKKNKLILVGIIGFVLIIVFILLLILISSISPDKTTIVDDSGEVIDATNGEIDPLLNEIYILSEDLELADPSLDSVPFPPVDMELRLDPKTKN